MLIKKGIIQYKIKIILLQKIQFLIPRSTSILSRNLSIISRGLNLKKVIFLLCFRYLKRICRMFRHQPTKRNLLTFLFMITLNLLPVLHPALKYG